VRIRVRVSLKSSRRSVAPEVRPALSAAQVLSQFLEAAVPLPQDGGPMIRKKLGEVLFERKQISWLDLQAAVREQSTDRAVLLGEIILRQGHVDRCVLIAALEELTRTRYVDCSAVQFDAEALSLLPCSAAERYCVLPLKLEGRTLHIALAEPQNLSTLDDLRFLTGVSLKARLGFRDEVLSAITRAYLPIVVDEENWVAGGDAIEFVSASARQSNQLAITEFQEELRGTQTPAVHLVSDIVRTAIVKKASDIHVEQTANEAVIRIRIDGVLRELLRVPSDLRMQLVSRIKILADLDIAERRVSQDGRFLARLESRHIDFRVSTLPTQYGEKIVMRLLEGGAATVPFEELGITDQAAIQLQKLLAAPQGMLLVTGPTGSGKSTTLYSALNILRSPSVNITTVEDPVEYVIPGINQVQVNSKAGRTFASCLRSILRQDPNVVMLGEVRDCETAEIALTAAQTGHLVLSTLHTNDSVSAITRLIDLGVPAYLIASSVTAVIAQRLVRKLCSCRREVPVTQEYAFRMRGAGFDEVGETMYTPVGCDACEMTGYQGRIGIYELLLLNEYLRSAIRAGARDSDVRSLARLSGFESMSDDALRKIHDGITTLDEVQRVVPLQAEATRTCLECSQFLGETFLYCSRCGTPVPEQSEEVPLKLPVNW
jgi:type IV pilus assembly protein PilB